MTELTIGMQCSSVVNFLLHLKSHSSGRFPFKMKEIKMTTLPLFRCHRYLRCLSYDGMSTMCSLHVLHMPLNCSSVFHPLEVS